VALSSLELALKGMSMWIIVDRIGSGRKKKEGESDLVIMASNGGGQNFKKITHCL
jgi:hypothetical protein